jgi:hypothetical protein
LDIICDEIPLKDLLVSYLLNGLPDDVTLYSTVLVHDGDMSYRKQLVNIGDFVKVTSNNVILINIRNVMMNASIHDFR